MHQTGTVAATGLKRYVLVYYAKAAHLAYTVKHNVAINAQ